MLNILGYIFGEIMGLSISIVIIYMILKRVAPVFLTSSIKDFKSLMSKILNSF